MSEGFEQRAITEALNRIDSFGLLGRNTLAQSRLVRMELTRMGAPDTPFQRGRALSRLIREEVRRRFEEREEDPRRRDVAEWSILYLRVHDGLSLQEIANRLGMPLRSVARYYGRAKELLLDRLYTLEDRSAAAGMHCPLCGALLAGLDAEGIATCGCGAEVTVTAREPDRLQIVATPQRPVRGE